MGTSPAPSQLCRQVPGTQEGLELPLCSLPRAEGTEWSGGAAGRDGDLWLPPRDVSWQQHAVVTGAISENPSVWYVAPHRNARYRQ